MKTKKSKKLFIPIITIGVVLIALWVIFMGNKPEEGTQTPVQTNNWIMYTNQKYGFELQHPKDWDVLVTEDNLAPRINVYPKSNTQKPPYIHHDDATNVSIFPQGVPTEGVMAQTATSTIKFGPEIRQAIDFQLKDGKRWATYAGFMKNPASWEDWGFVWARAELQNEKVQCVEGTRVIAETNCDIGTEFENAETVWSGTFNQTDRDTTVKILESLKFI